MTHDGVTTEIASQNPRIPGFTGGLKMKPLVVIDPGMDLAVGHHLFANSEIARSAHEMGFDCSFVASRACNPDDFRFLGCEVIPAFSIGPYVSGEHPEEDLASYMAAERELAAEYEAVVIPDGAYVLMHTSSPWHLRAAAARLKQARDVRVAIGLMLAMSYWTREPRMAALLEAMKDDALSGLNHHDCFVYSEAGEVDGAGTLSLPVSAQTLAGISELEKARSARRKRREVRMGYFGRPRPEKGFNGIVEAISQGVFDGQAGVTVSFFLPAGYSEVSNQISRLSPFVQASSFFRDNRRYIADMMSVDVVLCFYDPLFYGAQMSGIVSEAALLGKAVLTVKGTALHRFLDQYSPGSYCAINFSQDTLIKAVTQPGSVWREKQRRARASMGVVRELKRAERFFGVAFGFEPDDL